MCPPPKVPVDWGRFRAVLFDLDGVITQSARVHAAAWKETFDDFLARYSKTTGTPFEPFDIHRDYTRHVDGLPRRDGIRAFLNSRGLSLAESSPDAPATSDTSRSRGDDLAQGAGRRHHGTCDLLSRSITSPRERARRAFPRPGSLATRRP